MNRYVAAAAAVTVPLVAAAIIFAVRSATHDAVSAGPVPTVERSASTASDNDSAQTSTGEASPTQLAETSPSWERLPRAPVRGRIAEGVVWTGHEMIVWGGVSSPGLADFPFPVADGAAYDPTSRSWRTLAPAPAGVRGAVGTAAAWSGKVAVFWAGNSPDGPAVGAVYSPKEDSWWRLPDGPLGPRESYASVWTGGELLIIGGSSGDTHADPVAAAVNPRTGAWRLLPGLNKYVGLMPSGALSTGHDVFIAGSLSLCPEQGSACGRSRPIFLLYDPASDEAREVDVAGAPVQRRRLSSLVPVGWTGTAVVFVTRGAHSGGVVFYEPATGAWRTGSAAPCTVGGQTAWLGNGFVTSCGKNRLLRYDVRADGWQVVAEGASPLASRAGSAIVRTDGQLLVWSGTASRPGNPTPNSGSAVTLAP